MWKCPKCERGFRNVNQNHFCGKIETIDEYISEQDEGKRETLQKVRECIRAAAPEAVEKIAWQMPAFWQGKNLVQFAAHKNHIGFYPGDLTLAPFADRLEGIDMSKGSIRFAYDKIDFELITHITAWRVKNI